MSEPLEWRRQGGSIGRRPSEFRGGRASVRSNSEVWSRRESPRGEPRAGEMGGGLWGNSRCRRIAEARGSGSCNSCARTAFRSS